MSDKVVAAALAGSVAALAALVFGSIAIVGACLSCLAVLGSGVGAVWYHTRRQGGSADALSGAGLGAGAAAVMFAVDSAISAVLTSLGLRPGWEEATQRAIERFEDQGFSEQQLEAVRQMTESGSLLALALGCALVGYALLGAIGGAIGASAFGGDAPNAGASASDAPRTDAPDDTGSPNAGSPDTKPPRAPDDTP